MALTLPPFSPPQSTLLLKALAHLLRPLVSLCIRSGVTFPIFADLLRGLYVEVAANELLPEPRMRTDSRISLLTGVHRKEIRRLRGIPGQPETPPATLTLSSQIISRWLGMPDYLDPTGAPLALPRTATSPAPSFESLVEAVTTDLRARAVLDQWLSQGMVTLDANDQVHLNTAAFIPKQEREEQMFYFARNLHDHLAAAAANVLATDTPPFPDLSVHYDHLGLHAASELERAARNGARQLLLDINRTALDLASRDNPAGSSEPDAGPRRRVNFGVYLFTENEPAGAAR